MRAEIRRILVPLDGSRLAEAVLPYVWGLAAKLDASVQLLHVVERSAPATVHGERHLREVPSANEYLAEVSVRGSAAGVRVDTHVHEDATRDVAASIAAHAVELECTLVAISTHGSGGLRDLLLGNIAQQTLHRGTTSVLLVRPAADGSAPPFRCGEVVLALEPAEHGGAALPVAAQLARTCGARLHLVTVVPGPAELSPERRASAVFSPGAIRALLDLEHEDAAAHLQETGARLEAQGVQVTSEVRRGDAVAEVIRMLEREGADLLILATHGQAGLGALLGGSFAPRIMARARVPVLLVRLPS